MHDRVPRRAETSVSFVEVCELTTIGALGWVFGVWVWKGLSAPVAPGAALLAAALLWTTFGMGETRSEVVVLHGVGGGWFLLLAAGPLVTLQWLVLRLVPAAAAGRGETWLGAVVAVIAAILLLRCWRHRTPDST